MFVLIEDIIFLFEFPAMLLFEYQLLLEVVNLALQVTGDPARPLHLLKALLGLVEGALAVGHASGNHLAPVPLLLGHEYQLPAVLLGPDKQVLPFFLELPDPHVF